VPFSAEKEIYTKGRQDSLFLRKNKLIRGVFIFLSEIFLLVLIAGIS